MTAPIGLAASGLSATLIANAANVRQQVDKLTQQASTGLQSDTYAGLDSMASTSLNLNPQLATLRTYQSNIDRASGNMQVTQIAMTQIQQIGLTFVSDIPNLNGMNPSEIDSVAANARSALVQVASLLNTKNGAVFVFAGQDSSNPPVPDPDSILSSGFYTQINAAVSSLSASGAGVTASTTLTVAASSAAGTSPFSAYLSQAPAMIGTPAVNSGDNTMVRTGLLASANSAAISAGPSTTGSYMRDLMRALATLGSLSGSQVNDPEFAGLVKDTGTSLNGVVTAMATDVGVLGTIQSDLTTTQTHLSATATALTSQISSVDDADMAATLSKLTAMQVQLQASYRLITNSNSLSLMNFLPGG